MGYVWYSDSSVGGPGGLSMAYELKKAGYRNVVVIEQSSRIGGRCETIEVEGKKIEIGAIVSSSKLNTLMDMVKDLSVEIEIENNTKTFNMETLAPVNYYPEQDFFEAYTKFNDGVKKQVAIPGMYPLSALHYPTHDFLASAGLDAFRKMEGIGFTSAGYGSVNQTDQEIPMAYFTRYLNSAKPPIYRLKEGLESMWKTMVEQKDINVMLNTTVTSVEYDNKRDTLEIAVKRDNGTSQSFFLLIEYIGIERMEFDKLVVACPLTNASSLVPPSVLPLIEQIKTIEYYTIVCFIEDMSKWEFL